ncbi:unnamed protein product [Urochloa humidicola]
MPARLRVTSDDEEEQRCMGLSWSSQRSSPKPKIADRGISNICQVEGQGNKMTAIQSNERLKTVLRQAKQPNSKLVVLEFTAPWSEPCKFMRPAMEEIASLFNDRADFYTLDVEQFKVHEKNNGVCLPSLLAGLQQISVDELMPAFVQTFARNTRVEALPTFLLVRKTILERVVGVSKDELQRSIQKHVPSAPTTDLIAIHRVEGIH